MKKYFPAAILATAAMCCSADNLPTPNTDGGMPLMEAIAKRQSHRDMTTEDISKQDLSNILWAAWGITHDGKHTIATARNLQELSIYVITPQGASLYNPAKHSLEKITDADVREFAAAQDFAKACPLNIAFVVDSDVQANALYQGYAAGAASQNIYLYCAANGLKTVVRGSFDREGLQKALNLPANKQVLLVQTVGK